MSLPSFSASPPLPVHPTRWSSSTTRRLTSLGAPLPPREPFSWHTGIRSQRSSALISRLSSPCPPGAVVRPVSTLPTLILSQGGQLLINQAVARLTSSVNIVALRDGPSSVVPQSFINRYSELPSVAFLPFATVLLSPTDGPVWGMGPPTESSLRLHGGPTSHPDPDGDGVAPSARYALPRLRGYGLHPVSTADPIFPRVMC